MKLRNKGLAVAFSAALGLGVTGEAAADVYGLSYLEINNLFILFGNPPDVSNPQYTFSTNADAILNLVPDASSGAASCNSFSIACGATPNPRLSGTVQNAPGGGVTRSENDYQKFGLTAEYSNAESAIETATLLGDATTKTRQIAESNLQTGSGAQANTNVASNTFVTVDFTSASNTLVVNFDAIIDVLSQVTGGDIGLAQASSSVSVVLTSATGQTLVSWAPEGNGVITTCAAPLVCIATELDAGGGPAVSLNNTTSSFGAPNQVAGTGNYNIFINGLTTGADYTLALATSGLTDLARTVPVPGTLFLMGAGLLLGGRTLRRRERGA